MYDYNVPAMYVCMAIFCVEIYLTPDEDQIVGAPVLEFVAGDNDAPGQSRNRFLWRCRDMSTSMPVPSSMLILSPSSTSRRRWVACSNILSRVKTVIRKIECSGDKWWRERRRGGCSDHSSRRLQAEQPRAFSLYDEDRSPLAGLCKISRSSAQTLTFPARVTLSTIAPPPLESRWFGGGKFNSWIKVEKAEHNWQVEIPPLEFVFTDVTHRRRFM